MPGAVIISQTGTGATPWKNPNTDIAPFQLQVDISLSGAATYTLEYTQSDYVTVGAPVLVHPTTVVAATAAGSFLFNFPVRGWRLNVTAGTGTVTAEAMQAGIANQ